MSVRDGVRVLLIFLDGVGLGDDADYNPFAHAALPAFHTLLDGARPLLRNSPLHATAASLVALDATLGVRGTPQSGTGQAALFTGRNAARLHGRHFGPWVPAALRPLLRTESILSRAVNAGIHTTFANAYPRVLLDMAAADAEAERIGAARPRLPQYLRAGPPVAAAGAGLLTRDATDLLRGDAVASEILNEGWRERLGHLELPEISAAEAGSRLAAIASRNELTLFAHYATDTVGHEQDIAGAVAAVERVDQFLGGVIRGVPDDMMTIIASDHGNIEDVRTGHTRNPALGLIAGPRHATYAARAGSLLDVAPLIAELLGIPPLPATGSDSPVA